MCKYLRVNLLTVILCKGETFLSEKSTINYVSICLDTENITIILLVSKTLI